MGKSVAPSPQTKFHAGLCAVLLLLSVPSHADVPVPTGIDAALPIDASAANLSNVANAGEGWRIFRLRTLRHARVATDSVTWRSGVPQVADSEWLKLAAPTGPFRPMLVVPGQRGYFYLVDAASGRLCLYDADAALLSTFALPKEFVPFRAGRMAVFRGTDGAFTFLDYATGEAWQFADRQTADAGATGWIPRGRTKLPAGVNGCLQPAGSAELFCLDGERSPLHFDGALNKISTRPHTEKPSHRKTIAHYAVWEGIRSRWILRGEASGRVLFLFDPESKSWIVTDSLTGTGASVNP